MADRSLFPNSDKSKSCSSCKLTKLLSEFNRNKNGDPLSQCRDCRRAACRSWYKRNIESERERARNRMRVYGPKERERNKRWAAANPYQARLHSRKKLLSQKYKMTIGEHDALFASQGFVCGACSSPSPNSKKGWSTDHCHKTKIVRGIVCHHCNIGIGHAKDSIKTLRMWIAYLERSNGNPRRIAKL